MIECPNCHSQLEEESSFCPNCGHKLKNEVQISAQAKHSRKKPVIIIAVIMVLVVVFFAVNTLVLKPGRIYEDAVAAIDEGNYEEALELLSEIPDFSKTPIALTSMYDDALKMVDHGNLTEAYSLFSELSELNFEDSTTQLERVTDLIIEDQLPGVWTTIISSDESEGAQLLYSFNDGVFQTGAIMSGITIPGATGTYTIGNGKISIAVSGGNSEQYYEIVDGILHLYMINPSEYSENEIEKAKQNELTKIS